MIDKDGVSVVIPTARVNVSSNLLSVINALSFFEGEKELIIAVDREIDSNDSLCSLTEKHPFVKIYKTQKNRGGSANARFLALRMAQYPVILFTDDDCIVPIDWVLRMYAEVQCHGIIAGNLCSADPENKYSSIDAYVDQLRIRSVDECGNTKYTSFPNFGIDRRHLPEIPFSISPLDTTEDIDLSCQLRLMRLPIFFDENILVETAYPATFFDLLKRKIKHAKGIAFLRSRLGKERCVVLGLAETPWQMLVRWNKLALDAPFNPMQKLIMSIACTAYSVALFYYDKKFSGKFDENGGII